MQATLLLVLKQQALCGSRVELSDLANKHIGHLIKFEFQIKEE